MSQHAARGCARLEGIPQVGRGALDPSLREHVAGCPVCSATVRAVEYARAAAPARAPRPEQVEAMRQKLRTALARAVPPPASRRLRRPLLAAFSAAVLAAGVLWVVGSPAGDAPASLVRLSPHAGARFSQESSPAEETITLQAGTLEVEAPGPGPRIRVRVGGDQIVTESATFSVTAGWEHTEVEVSQGTLAVLPAAGAPRIFAAGDRWEETSPAASVAASPPAITAAPAPAPLRETPAAPRPAAKPAPRAPAAHGEAASLATPTAPTPSSAPAAVVPDGEIAFREGVDALRVGDFSTAEARFARAAEGGSLAEEASFWRAVALTRAGRSDEAREALTSFLARYPGAARAGEAHAALGWALLAAGDRAGAAQQFTAAQGDSSAAVRDNAARGLRQLEALRSATQPAPTGE